MTDGKLTRGEPGPELAASEACSGAAARPGAGPADATATQETTPDSELIAASLTGDTAAFGRLVERHQDRLFNSLLRFTGSADDAQDIAQEAFVQAFTKLDRFRSDSAFFTWLYRIAMNRAISASRKRRERVSLDGMNESGAGADPACHTPPEAPTIAAERVEMVHRALATLAEEHREVLVLREFDGLDYQEIAAIVAVPVGTVRSRLFRARSQLREALAPFERDDEPTHRPS